MQVVSGPTGTERVHFKAPAAKRLVHCVTLPHLLNAASKCESRSWTQHKLLACQSHLRVLERAGFNITAVPVGALGPQLRDEQTPVWNVTRFERSSDRPTCSISELGENHSNFNPQLNPFLNGHCSSETERGIEVPQSYALEPRFRTTQELRPQ
jgi:hypothetical protein